MVVMTLDLIAMLPNLIRNQYSSAQLMFDQFEAGFEGVQVVVVQVHLSLLG